MHHLMRVRHIDFLVVDMTPYYKENLGETNACAFMRRDIAVLPSSDYVTGVSHIRRRPQKPSEAYLVYAFDIYHWT